MDMMVISIVSVLMGAVQTQDKMFMFATVDEGRKILTARDEHVQALSPFDRAARVKTGREVSEAEYLAFVGRNVLDWTEAEKQNVTATLDIVRQGLSRFPLPLPKVIYLVKTTGDEEGNAAYTRDNGLILPKSYVAAGQRLEPELVYHEVFHILSRANPRLREKLYHAIGFERCGAVTLPQDLRARQITNPDGPRNDHGIAVQVDGRPVWAVPILLSKVARYDPNRGGAFFDYMEHRFLVVARDGNSPPAKMPPAGQEPRLVPQDRLSGFFEQVGRNTQYTIHPDEILADNFARLMMRDPNVPSPEILQKIESILSAGSADANDAPPPQAAATRNR